MRLRAALRRVWHIIQTQWILVNLFIAVLIAILAPAPGIAVVSVEAGPFRLFQLIPILIVFLIAGATLATKEIAAGLKHWPGVVFGFVSILGVTPCLGFALAALPVSPPEFPAGLAIFAAAPTTLGVGAALVRSCHGNGTLNAKQTKVSVLTLAFPQREENAWLFSSAFSSGSHAVIPTFQFFALNYFANADSLATFLMIGTSILSVFTIPFWLKALLGTLEISGIETVAIDIGQMLWRLVATVLAPATVGKLLREFCPPVRAFVTRWKVLLGMLSVSCLAFIVWQTLSGAQEQLLEQDGLSVLYVILAAVIQHGIYLVR
jgi:solute carrier family 10 (sodium/bile acid cotransporter), member 7